MKRHILAAAMLVLSISATPVFATDQKSVAGSVETDIQSVKQKMDSMDKVAGSVKGQLDSLGDKIKESEAKIKAAEEAQKAGKPNYFMPIIGGAILGLGLAYWLKNRKKGGGDKQPS